MNLDDLRAFRIISDPERKELSEAKTKRRLFDGIWIAGTLDDIDCL